MEGVDHHDAAVPTQRPTGPNPSATGGTTASAAPVGAHATTPRRSATQSAARFTVRVAPDGDARMPPLVAPGSHR